jgi:DNA-directed RNA polymerase specialized sigma24 family protein
MDSQPHGHQPKVSFQARTVTTDVAQLTEIRRHETGELLRRARAGERAALDQLVERLTPLVWNVARAQGLGKEAASGAVQATWVTFLKNMQLIESPKALVGWLITATRRNARTTHTTRQRAELVEPRDPDPSVTGIITREHYQCLWENLQKLPPTCQELLRILAFTGHTGLDVLDTLRDGIGPACGQCLNTFRTLLQHDPRWS